MVVLKQKNSFSRSIGGEGVKVNCLKKWICLRTKQWLEEFVSEKVCVLFSRSLDHSISSFAMYKKSERKHLQYIVVSLPYTLFYYVHTYYAHSALITCIHPYLKDSTYIYKFRKIWNFFKLINALVDTFFMKIENT